MTFRTLLLGSAAALLTVGGAQAADLAVAEPVSYVKVCDAFGAGYWYSPGTQTCLRIGGYTRFEALYDDNGGSSGDPTTDDHFFRTAFELNVTAKSMTEGGPLTAYIALGFISGYSGIGGGTTNSLTGIGYVGVSQAYLEWGPILAGYTTSTFTYAAETSYLGSLFPAHARTDLVRFSWATGPLGIQLEAADYRDRANSTPTGSIPDLVAAATFKSGILDLKIAGGYGDRVSGGVWGVLGGIGLDLSMIAKGDRLAIVAGYSDGASDWIDYKSYGGCYAGQSCSTSFAASGNWSFLGASFKHYFVPKFNVALAASTIRGTGGSSLTRGTITAQYDLATNLFVGLEAVYQDRDASGPVDYGSSATDGWTGRIRLQRNFP